MTTETITRSQKFAADLAALLRARNPLIWIKTGEEARVERFVFEAAAAAKFETRFWDVAAGITKLDGKSENRDVRDIEAVLGVIQERSEKGVPGQKESRTVWVIRDPSVWLEGLPGASPLRKLRNLTRLLPEAETPKAQSIIVLSAKGDVPAELNAITTVIDWPLPDRAEIAAILDAAISVLPEDKKATACPSDVREAAVDAAIGLSGDEAAACYAKSLVQYKPARIDPLIVANEKKRVVSREKVLEWIEPLKDGLDGVGGLDVLKGWLLKRKLAYSPSARAYGLPSPKGCFLFGISGCGKSLTAKAIATAWGVPLLKLDLGALKGKFVGESEQNIRKAFRVIEALGRCVVWIDEIEKAMQGATSGSADGGVSADALGAVLTWMQERTSEAFVIATANDPSGLPPELLRKGRWDEMFFIDLPTQEERVQVISAALRANGRAGAEIDAEAVAERCGNFTGAEIAAIVPEAMFNAFADGEREVTTEDLIGIASSVVPLATTAEKKINELRAWAEGKARTATSQAKPEPIKARGRKIEVA